MTATLATLLQDCRYHIGDTSDVAPIFTDLQLTTFINAAIRDLNNHFPRTLSATISVTAGTHAYDLEVNFIDMLKVEYPTGQAPAAFIKYRSSKLPTFWGAAGYYDIYRPQDQDSSNPPQIIISEPIDSETITYTYRAEHNLLTDSGDECTILDRYVHLIPLYVRFKAWQELSTSEGMDPDPIKLLAATQEINAERAEKAYYKALDQAKKTLSVSEIVDWKMPGNDRIY